MQFSQIVQAYRLGMLLNPPAPVLGGLMHTTYRIDTAEGSFALKVLNSSVMARPEALSNMIASEKIAAALSAFVPAVHALTADGSPVVRIGDEYVMLYPWLSAKPLFPSALTPRHAAAVGDVLGKIHAADVKIEGDLPFSNRSRPDWPALRQLAQSGADGGMAPELSLAGLEELEESVREAEKKLGNRTVLSHRDLDAKNVLWTGDKPSVIDWEAAGPIRPDTELCDAVLAWADDGTGELSKALGSAFLEAYRACRPTAGVDWEAAFAASARGPLDWLAYNIRRAAGDGAENKSARRLGAAEASRTVHALKRRSQARAFLLDLVGEG
ncbi:MAG: phosphotransferase [Clostridia bacterium]|nr:phosphotransferase [Clostridia bacterium]